MFSKKKKKELKNLNSVRSGEFKEKRNLFGRKFTESQNFARWSLISVFKHPRDKKDKAFCKKQINRIKVEYKLGDKT